MRCVGKELGEGREGRRRKENGKKWRGTEGETDIDRLHRGKERLPPTTTAGVFQWRFGKRRGITLELACKVSVLSKVSSPYKRADLTSGL